MHTQQSCVMELSYVLVQMLPGKTQMYNSTCVYNCVHVYTCVYICERKLLQWQLNRLVALTLEPCSRFF